MFVSGCWMAGILTLVTLSTPAYAQVGAEALPNVDSIHATAERIVATRCLEVACRSVRLLDEAIQLQIEGASATIGRPRPLPRDRDARVARRRRRLVAQGRRMAPEVCRQAAGLLFHYGDPGVPSDVIVPVALLDLASRLDGSGVGAGSGCTRAVISAMPATPAADIAIHNARVLCSASDGGGQCADITR